VIGQLLTRTAGALSASQRVRLRGALQELLFNAVEHGALELGYRAKRQALAHGVYEAVLRARVAAARVRRRPVTIEIRHERKAKALTYRITDAGRGFNWRRRLLRFPHGGAAAALSGRGIVLARALCPTLTYNERGNEVIITVPLT
jgi:anti-sigma regulatory factor (Ser/Thr protein kinase)